MHAIMFYFLFRNFYQETYKKREKKLALAASKKDNYIKANGTNGNNANGEIYVNHYKMTTGYISDNGMRNRVFIDKQEVEQ